MGGNVICRGETRPINRVSSILQIINTNHNNLELALETLSSYEGAPRSKEDIDRYVKDLTDALTDRLVGGNKRHFSDASDNEIREKLFVPFREYFEKTSDKLIIEEQGKTGLFFPDTPLGKGQINIHSLLVELYRLGGANSAVVNYGPISLSFSHIKHHIYYTYPRELYIGFHPTDATELFSDKILELLNKKFIRINYTISLDSSGKTIIINTEKPRPKPESAISKEPKGLLEGYIETMEEVRQKASEIWQKELVEMKRKLEEKDKEIEGLKELLAKTFLAKQSSLILEEEIARIEKPMYESLIPVPKHKELLERLEALAEKELPAKLGLNRPISDMEDVLDEIKRKLTSYLFGVVEYEKKDTLDENEEEIFGNIVKLVKHIKSKPKDDRLTESDVVMLREFSYILRTYVKGETKEQQSTLASI
jgi:hypothetical protein